MFQRQKPSFLFFAIISIIPFSVIEIIVQWALALA